MNFPQRKTSEAPEDSNERFSLGRSKPEREPEIFEKIKEIGQGGFSVVYLVCAPKTQTIYAFKTLKDSFIQDPVMKERFVKEAIVWHNLGHHPFIVNSPFSVEISGKLYIAMEYIPKNEKGFNSLECYIKNQPPDLAQTLRWAIQFCYGMEYAYSKGIRCHGDIKPGNILIDQDKTLKISDFGLEGGIFSYRMLREKVLDAHCQIDESSLPKGASGTPTHMAPEQFLGGRGADQRSDVYSFGIVLYQMVSGGELPFIAHVPKSNYDLDQLHFWEDMYQLHSSKSVPILNSPIYPIIQRCLAKQPRERYKDFTKMREDLESLLRTLTGEVVPMPPNPIEPSAEQAIRKNAVLYCPDQTTHDFNASTKCLSMNIAFSLNSPTQTVKTLEFFESKSIAFPNSADALINKGICLNNLGRTTEASACFDKALKINPLSEEVWNHKATCLSKMNQIDQAIACYDQALKINPKFKEAWSNKAICQNKAGRTEEAMLSLLKVLEIDNHFESLKTMCYGGNRTAKEKVDFEENTVDDLTFTVTSPSLVRPGDFFVVDIWTHLDSQRKEVIKQAREALGNAEILIKSKGTIEVARGSILSVRLKIDELTVKKREDTIVWKGKIGNADFPVSVPENVKFGKKLGLATIHVNGLQIVDINFAIEVGNCLSSIGNVETEQKQIRTAFASYSSEDLEKVLSRIQGFQKIAPKLKIYLDKAFLQSGQYWEEELLKIIRSSDIFYLFWSQNAAKSEWVKKEWQCAFNERGLDFIDPVPLVDPEQVPPPPELARKHFNDWVLAYMRNKGA
jgi:serine/threonine protein kinase